MLTFIQVIYCLLTLFFLFMQSVLRSEPEHLVQLFVLCVFKKWAIRWCVRACVSLPRNAANFSFYVFSSHLRGRTRNKNKRGTFDACLPRWGWYFLNIWIITQKQVLICYGMTVFKYIFDTWLHSLKKKMYTPMGQELEVKKNPKASGRQVFHK